MGMVATDVKTTQTRVARGDATPTAIGAVAPGYVLRGVTGDLFGRIFHIERPSTIGRSPECDIHIDDPGISREHARLIPLDKGLRIEDMNSTNGSYINDLQVNCASALDGDEVRFDRLRFRVEVRHGPEAVARGELRDAREQTRRSALWTAIGVAVVAIVGAVTYAALWAIS
ncbi:FHA domain-containing protein [Lysobacter terrae]